MSILSIILGVILIVGGIFCMFTPLATFLSAGHIIAIMLFIYGIFGVVRFFQKEAGALELISSILGIIVGVIAIVRPGGTLVIDNFVLNMVSAWLLVKGLIHIIVSIQGRNEIKGWGWGVAAGALSIVAGILSFLNPTITAMTVGILMGMIFMENGIDMIVLGTALGTVNR